MPTETWRRGWIVQPNVESQYRTSSGVVYDWQKITNVPYNHGFSDQITSYRGGRQGKVRRARFWKDKQGRLHGKYYWVRLLGPLQSPNPCYVYHKGSTSEGSVITDWIPRSNGSHMRFRGSLGTACAGLWEVPAVSTTSAVAAVESELFRKASDSKFEGVVQVGEILETLEMLRNPLRSLRGLGQELWQAMRKHKRLKGKELQEAVSGSWLEYQFGVAPLVNETGKLVYDVVEACRDPQKYERVYAQRTVLDETKTVRGNITLGSSSCSLHYTRVETRVVRVRGGMNLKIEGSAASKTDRLGLGFGIDTFQQAWQLMPLSFAVDWFVGIGPLLQECRMENGMIIGSFLSIIDNWTRDCVATHVESPWAPGQTFGVYAGSELYQNTLTRSTNVSRPGKLQLGSGIDSLNKGISAAALAAQPLSQLWGNIPWH